MFTGYRPVMTILEPWWESEFAPAVNESLQLHGTGADGREALSEGTA